MKIWFLEDKFLEVERQDLRALEIFAKIYASQRDLGLEYILVSPFPLSENTNSLCENWAKL